MWTLLYEGSIDAALCVDHFTFETYRRWFVVLAGLGEGALDEAAFHPVDHRERRALKRMLRVPPPPRVRANRALLIQALADRHVGNRIHIERLIN